MFKRRKKKGTSFRKKRSDEPDASSSVSTNPAVVTSDAGAENKNVVSDASAITRKIKRAKKKSKRKNKRRAAGMLSFGEIDESEDGQTKSKRHKKHFKIKKSKASRMIMKGVPVQLSIASETTNPSSQPNRGSNNVYSKESIKAQLRQQQLDQERMFLQSGIGGEQIEEGQVVTGADLEEVEAKEEEDLIADEEIERFKLIRARKRKTALGGYIPIGADAQAPDHASAFNTAQRLKSKFRKLTAGTNGEQKSLYDHMKEQSKNIFADSDNFEQQQIERASRVATSTTTKQKSSKPGSTFAIPSDDSKSSTMAAEQSHADIEARIRTKLEHLRSEQAEEQRKLTALRVQLDQTTSTVETMQTKINTAKGQYNFFLEIGDYVKALCGCLTEKREMILKVRDAYETAIKECEHEQRKKWSDAVQSVLARARSGTTHMQDEFGRDVGVMSNERWASRVKSLETFASDPTEVNLKAVMESGRGVPVAASDTLSAREEELREASTFIFDDVLGEYKELPQILGKFSEWRNRFADIYDKCHCSLSLGDLAAIFASTESLFWDPRRVRRRLGDWEWYEQLKGVRSEGKGTKNAGDEDKSNKWSKAGKSDKPGLGSTKKHAEGDDKFTEPLSRVVTLWLQPLLLSVVTDLWDPLAVEQTEALVETIQDTVAHLDTSYVRTFWTKMATALYTRAERQVDMLKQQAHAQALGGDTSAIAHSLLLNGVASALALFRTITIVCKAAEGYASDWTPKLQKLSVDLFRNCILRPTNQLLESGNRQSDYQRVGRFTMKLYPSQWLSQHIASDTALRLFLQRVSSR